MDFSDLSAPEFNKDYFNEKTYENNEDDYTSFDFCKIDFYRDPDPDILDIYYNRNWYYNSWRLERKLTNLREHSYNYGNEERHMKICINYYLKQPNIKEFYRDCIYNMIDHNSDKFDFLRRYLDDEITPKKVMWMLGLRGFFKINLETNEVDIA